MLFFHGSYNVLSIACRPYSEQCDLERLQAARVFRGRDLFGSNMPWASYRHRLIERDQSVPRGVSFKEAWKTQPLGGSCLKRLGRPNTLRGCCLKGRDFASENRPLNSLEKATGSQSDKKCSKRTIQTTISQSKNRPRNFPENGLRPRTPRFHQ